MTLEWMKIKSLINQIQSSLPEPNKGSFQIMCDGSGDFSSTFFSPEGVVSRSAALEFLGRRVGMAFLGKSISGWYRVRKLNRQI